VAASPPLHSARQDRPPHCNPQKAHGHTHTLSAMLLTHCDCIRLASAKRHLLPGWSEERDEPACATVHRSSSSFAAHLETRLLWTLNFLAVSSSGAQHWPSAFCLCRRRYSSTTCSFRDRARPMRLSPSCNPLRLGVPSLRSFCAGMQDSLLRLQRTGFPYRG
jgi:hypothetical protein